MALLGESRGLGGEIKLFPPPIFKGEHERWEDWSWQLKAYVALYKPVAQELMTRVEGSASVIDDTIHYSSARRKQFPPWTGPGKIRKAIALPPGKSN